MNNDSDGNPYNYLYSEMNSYSIGQGCMHVYVKFRNNSDTVPSSYFDSFMNRFPVKMSERKRNTEGLFTVLISFYNHFQKCWD